MSPSYLYENLNLLLIINFQVVGVSYCLDCRKGLEDYW